MKILHVITSLRTGGAEKLMVDLLPRMKSCVEDVGLCVFDGTRTPFYESLEAQGVKIHALGHSVYSPAHVLKLLSLMRQYDVVHAHNTACQYYVAMAGLFVSRRLVTTEHNTTNRRRSGWWKPLDRWMYRQYDTVICISELTQENLLQHIGRGLQNRCVVIHNGIDVARFKVPLHQEEVDAGRHTILMVSAFREQKDQKTLIRALSLLPSAYRVLFAGGGEPSLIAECQQLVARLGLTSRVEFLGVRTDIPFLLEQTDVVVLSSHYEGLSLSSLEGMASGRPFIASDVEGLRDIVGGYGILFPHGDDKALSVAIRKVCENEDFRKDVVKKCQERARMFDISVMAERYMEVYQYGSVQDESVMQDLPSYSVAIRTLGIAGGTFVRELQSIAAQTVKPERVLVYVADDCDVQFEDGQYCGEQYIPVKRGMVAQRALPYDEIDSEYLLLLDDDVELASRSVEKMLQVMVENDADCVGADTYKNQNMPLWQKVYAALTNLVYPHCDRRWAFKIHRNGSFSYLANPPKGKGDALPTQYVAGPCALWKKEAVRRLHWEDELWMDEMEFSYMDDTAESYKLHVNGGKMYLLYDSGVENLNAKTASGSYRSKATMFYTRSRLSFCVWWRTIYEVEKTTQDTLGQQAMTVSAYLAKSCILVIVNLLAGIAYLDVRIPYFFVKGIVDGWKFVHSEAYRKIRPYKFFDASL